MDTQGKIFLTKKVYSTNDYYLNQLYVSACLGVYAADKSDSLPRTMLTRLGRRFRQCGMLRKIDAKKDLLFISIPDLETEDFSRYFYEISIFIDKIVSNGRNLLVIGDTGNTQTAVAILAYFIWKYKVDYQFAYNHLLDIRKTLNVNRSFKAQLEDWAAFNQFNFTFTKRKKNKNLWDK